MAVEALGALGEALAAILEFVITITCAAVRCAVEPIRFLVSPRFRKVCRERWQKKPGLRRSELAGGSVGLLFFAAVASAWIWLFARPEPEPPPPPPPLAGEPGRPKWWLRIVFDKKAKDPSEKHRKDTDPTPAPNH